MNQEGAQAEVKVEKKQEGAGAEARVNQEAPGGRDL